MSWRPPVSRSWFAPIVPEGVRDLASGNPDPGLLPDLRAVLSTMEPPAQLYGGEPVLEELRLVAVRELERDGISAADIAVVSGALDGIERVLQAHLRPGDLVAVEDPGYAGLLDLLRTLGLVLRPVPIDDRGMVPSELSKALREGVSAVLVSPRGQNPTGAALDPRRAEELRGALEDAPDAIVIEDDHLGPIAGSARLTLTTGRRRWAAARSAAKSLGPDLRLAILAGDGETMSRVRGRQAVGPQWVSHLLQRLVATLWASPEVEAKLRHATETYRLRRERFLDALHRRGIEAKAPSGISVWIEVPEETHVVQSLLAAGWAVAPGAPHRLQSGRAVRVTVSGLLEEESDDLAAAMERALRPGERTRTA